MNSVSNIECILDGNLQNSFYLLFKNILFVKWDQSQAPSHRLHYILQTKEISTMPQVITTLFLSLLISYKTTHSECDTQRILKKIVAIHTSMDVSCSLNLVGFKKRLEISQEIFNYFLTYETSDHSKTREASLKKFKSHCTTNLILMEAINHPVKTGFKNIGRKSTARHFRLCEPEHSSPQNSAKPYFKWISIQVFSSPHLFQNYQLQRSSRVC